MKRQATAARFARFILSVALLGVLFLSSCAPSGRGLPELRLPEKGAPAPELPAAIFPQGSWQFVHRIGFRLRAGGGEGDVLGILALEERSLSCALTTVEGLTLFAARVEGEGEVAVERALPPFDRPAFAAGLVEDIRTIFRPPPGKGQWGRLADGSPVLRFREGERVSDIRPRADGCWSMTLYRGGLRERRVRAENCRRLGAATIATDIELENYARTGYTLSLHLLEAARGDAAE